MPCIPLSWASRWLRAKESTCQCRRHGFYLWVGRIPWRRKWQPPPVFLPGKSHRERSLVGCGPWGRKESDTTEHAHTSFSLKITSYTRATCTQEACTWAADPGCSAVGCHCQSLTLPAPCPHCSIIVTTVQYLSSALHKNFTETDFDFKVGAPKIRHYLCNNHRKPKTRLPVFIFVFVLLKTAVLFCSQVCRSGIWEGFS